MSTARKMARLGGLFLGLASIAMAQKYTVKDLGVLSGDSASQGFGLSPSGEVVGCSDTSVLGSFPCLGSLPGHAFLWSSSGGMQDLGTLDGAFSIAYGVNNAGQVAGYSLDSQGILTAFLWIQSTGMTPLGALPGATYSYAFGVNSHGTIAGSSNSATSNGKIFAVLWNKSGSGYKVQKLPPAPRALYTLSGALNDSGEVAGFFSFGKPAKTHAFLWTKAKGTVDLGVLPGGTNSNANAINSLGTITGYGTTAAFPLGIAVNWDASGKIHRLGTLPGDSSSAGEGINDLGQVVGFSADSAGTSRAVLWSQAHGMQDLNKLIPANSGWSLIYAGATNKKGQITGYGTFNGENHAFLLTPR
jgi:probable HAF family extracellular repeat protein